jgi:hypothetical protein
MDQLAATGAVPHRACALLRACIRADPDGEVAVLVRELEEGAQVDVLVRLRELALAAASDRYEQLVSFIADDELKLLSRAERSAKGMLDDPTLTYGEVNFDTFAATLSACGGLAPGSVFLDCGHGAGKAGLVAALVTDVAEVRGYELLEGLHSVACEVARRAAAMFAADALADAESEWKPAVLLPPPVFYFACGSFTDPESPWASTSGAAGRARAAVGRARGEAPFTRPEAPQIVFANSTCFGSLLMARLASRAAAELRPGAAVVTFTRPLDHEVIVLTRAEKLLQSWGNAAVFVHRVVARAGAEPPAPPPRRPSPSERPHSAHPSRRASALARAGVRPPALPVGPLRVSSPPRAHPRLPPHREVSSPTFSRSTSSSLRALPPVRPAGEGWGSASRSPGDGGVEGESEEGSEEGDDTRAVYAGGEDRVSPVYGEGGEEEEEDDAETGGAVIVPPSHPSRRSSIDTRSLEGGSSVGLSEHTRASRAATAGGSQSHVRVRRVQWEVGRGVQYAAYPYLAQYDVDGTAREGRVREYGEGSEEGSEGSEVEGEDVGAPETDVVGEGEEEEGSEEAVAVGLEEEEGEGEGEGENDPVAIASAATSRLAALLCSFDPFHPPRFPGSGGRGQALARASDEADFWDEDEDGEGEGGSGAGAAAVARPSIRFFRRDEGGEAGRGEDGMSSPLGEGLLAAKARAEARQRAHAPPVDVVQDYEVESALGEEEEEEEEEEAQGGGLEASLPSIASSALVPRALAYASAASTPDRATVARHTYLPSAGGEGVRMTSSYVSSAEVSFALEEEGEEGSTVLSDLTDEEEGGDGGGTLPPPLRPTQVQLNLGDAEGSADLAAFWELQAASQRARGGGEEDGEMDQLAAADAVDLDLAGAEHAWPTLRVALPSGRRSASSLEAPSPFDAALLARKGRGTISVEEESSENGGASGRGRAGTGSSTPGVRDSPMGHTLLARKLAAQMAVRRT